MKSLSLTEKWLLGGMLLIKKSRYFQNRKERVLVLSLGSVQRPQGKHS